MGPLNIFILKAVESIYSYSDKQRENNPLETNASHSVAESEPHTVSRAGFPLCGFTWDTSHGERGALGTSECLTKQLLNAHVTINSNPASSVDCWHPELSAEAGGDSSETRKEETEKQC